VDTDIGKRFYLWPSMSEAKSIYFISDLHLGVPDHERSFQREKKVVQWLDWVSKDASEIYLLGDIFDMWFEYKYVVPRGYTRLLGKFAELADAGIQFHYFTGNHDMWVFDYFEKEMGMKIYREPITRTIQGKSFYIGHGDGLGKGDLGYKFIKRVFAGRFNQWLYARLHPNFAMGLAAFFSRKSRAANGQYDEKFTAVEDENLYHFCKEYLQNYSIDYFIFGHRHLKLDLSIDDKARYINLGQWLSGSSYAKFDGKQLELLDFEPKVD
jgi:UDP-2,3-diacylglucosamine hydrolase